jgi:hypothetical protein
VGVDLPFVLLRKVAVLSDLKTSENGKSAAHSVGLRAAVIAPAEMSLVVYLYQIIVIITSNLKYSSTKTNGQVLCVGKKKIYGIT